MQKVAVYDKTGATEEMLRQMTFWKQHTEFFLLDTVRTDDAFIHLLLCNDPDIVFMIKEAGEDGFWTKLGWMKERFQKVRFVVIGYEKTYEMAREAFLNGVFDYLVWPVKEEELEQTFCRLCDGFDLQGAVDTFDENPRYRLMKDKKIGKIA